MKLNITPGPWTYTMPRPEKFYAKISGKGWSDFAKVCVRTMDDESAIIEEQQGKDNVIAIITAIIQKITANGQPLNNNQIIEENEQDKDNKLREVL